MCRFISEHIRRSVHSERAFNSTADWGSSCVKTPTWLCQSPQALVSKPPLKCTIEANRGGASSARAGKSSTSQMTELGEGEQLNPRRDVVGVFQLPLNVEMSAEERRAQLRYQLLGGVCLGAEPVLQVAIEPLLGPAPMTMLMQAGGVEMLQPAKSRAMLTPPAKSHSALISLRKIGILWGHGWTRCVTPPSKGFTAEINYMHPGTDGVIVESDFTVIRDGYA